MASAAKGKHAATFAARVKAWAVSEHGPKTTHFWGPVANWGFVVAVSTWDNTKGSRERRKKMEDGRGKSMR